MPTMASQLVSVVVSASKKANSEKRERVIARSDEMEVRDASAA